MAITPFKVIQGHHFWYQSKACMQLATVCVNNGNLHPILHRFRDMVWKIVGKIFTIDWGYLSLMYALGQTPKLLTAKFGLRKLKKSLCCMV